jgi:hypothetical protein
MFTIGLVLEFMILGNPMLSFFGSNTFTLVQWMFHISGIILILIGVLIGIRIFKK